MGVAGKPIRLVKDVLRASAEPVPLRLMVVDINSGKLADVTLAAARSADDGAADGVVPPTGDDAEDRIGESLGIAVTTARRVLGGGVKVATVDPAGPGAAAGLEPGDLIVGVGDERVRGLDDFASSLPARGGAITLLVRDVRTGREVPVEAQAAAVDRRDDSAPGADAPPVDSPRGDAPAADRLGLSTELAFYKAEAAVRVVAVKPGSPASRAGVRAGWIIVAANDAPVLHPDDLAKVEASSTGRLVLRAVDPRDDRQFTITIAR